jgi:phage recombination protein Bet
MQMQQPSRADGGHQASPPDQTFIDLLERPMERKVEYTPFLGTEKISLSPGMVIKFLCRPTKSGQRCTEEMAVRFIMMCKARGLNPWEGDAFIVGYDTRDGAEFNLVTAHQAFLKRAEVHPEYDGMESGAVVKHTETEEIRDVDGDFVPDDCTLVGGWAKVYFKNRKIPTYRRLNLNSFDKGVSVWNSNKAGMICKCAEADALRSSFPNSLGGMYMDGEMPTAEATPAATPTNGDPPRRMSMQRPVEHVEKPAAAAKKEESPAQAGTADDRNPDDELPPIGNETTAAAEIMTPTWADLKQHGITAAVEDDGTAVFDSANRTLTPEGKWDDNFPGFTVTGRSDAIDLKAREMAAAAIGTATPVTPPEPPKEPPARNRRPGPNTPKN